MKIYIAADHAGFQLKRQLIQYLKVKGYEVEDMGAHTLDPDDDYPDFIIPCALRVAESHSQGKLDDVGIVIGGSGQGEAIAVNKVKGIRAAVYNTNRVEIARLAKEHNNANILSLGARFLTLEDAKKGVSAWLEAKFEGGRHVKRLEKIAKFES